MSRRFINELSEQESVDQVFLLTGKQVRANRQGAMYLQLRLSDRTGALNAMLWNATERIAASFDEGDYVRVAGTTQIYNNALQMIATKVERVAASEVDEGDFTTVDSGQVERLSARLVEILRGLQNPHLRSLAEAFLLDDRFMSQFSAAPAGVKNHHAYRGGLLDHVVSLMELAKLIGPRYPQLDTELLIVGVFLHDIGKVVELSYEREFSYTDEGQLIGHIVLGVELLNARVLDAEKLSGDEFPPELALRLKHMIVSHHGSLEFGSPTVPMTLEATALHHLDNLDAKMQSYGQLLREEAHSDSRWTAYQANVGRKLFKGEGY